MKGRFLAFEGIDGSGKRTLCRYTKQLLTERGIPVDTFQYPDYDSQWGKIIKEFLSGGEELDVSVQFLTYATDIIKDQKSIRRALKTNFVLADRYITSTVAFQCARGFDMQKAMQFVELFELVPPDVIFYMNVSPQRGQSRKKDQKDQEQSTLDRHEADLLFLEQVNKTYKYLCARGFLGRKWVEVDANRELSQVQADIEREIETLLG